MSGEHKSGYLMRMVKGAVLTAAAAVALYAGADYYLDKQYERNKEEKLKARQGIETLLQGAEQAKENVSPGYIDFLAEQGYWKKMKNVELISQQLLRVERGERSDQQTVMYRVRYHNKETGDVETNICTLDMRMVDGTWTIQGE